MSKPPHFAELERRYQATDSVSEYQRLWAIFNKWLIEHVGSTQDRQCIEAFKKFPETQNWTAAVISSTAVARTPKRTDGLTESLLRYNADNEISRLFYESYKSNSIEPRINYPWRTGIEPRVRQSNAITLEEDQFTLVYRCHGRMLHENPDFSGISLHQCLEVLGIYGTGCCFYKDSPNTNPDFPDNSQHYANLMVDIMRGETALAPLIELLDSTVITSITEDTIELLYNVRNAAMHGELDYLDESDNSAARAASNCLDSLMRDIIDNW